MNEKLDNAKKALHRYNDRNSKPNPAHLAGALADLIAIIEEGKVTQEARIHYSYGVNSGTLETLDTPESIADAVERYERASMGPIGVDKIETRTKVVWKTAWQEKA